MRKHLVLISALLLLSAVSIFAAGEAVTTQEKSIDWFQLLITIGYLGGTFLLLPVVIYTNLKEKLFVRNSDNEEEVQLVEGLTEEERNNRAALILDDIGKKLTPFQLEDGEDMISITSGKQAKFMKRGLDYIKKKLTPTNTEIIERVDEFTGVYEDRTRRAFTGSKWVIGCSAAIGLLFLFTMGFSGFMVIHFLGLLFYILSSKTTFYGIEKRMKYFSGGNFISSFMKGLFLGDGVKYYVKTGGGPWRRDWETEGQMAMIGLMFMLIAAMILGFFAAFFGVINFFLNYSTSFLLPFKSDDAWYVKNFSPVND